MYKCEFETKTETKKYPEKQANEKGLYPSIARKMKTSFFFS